MSGVEKKNTGWKNRIKKNGAVVAIVAVLLLSIIVGVVSNVWGGGKEISLDPNDLSGGGQQIPQLSGNAPHGQIAVDYIQTLNDRHYDRFSFSYREMHTAAWLVETLLAMGYSKDQIEVQEFTLDEVWNETGVGMVMEIAFFLDSSPFLNLGTRSSRKSQNVILTVPGQSDEMMVVSAHYDSVMFPGASDNASGVALLLESAQRMQNKDNYYTIVYAFFGAEEGGIIGASYYVNSLTQRQHDDIKFVINADVLIEGPDLFYMAGYDNNGKPGANSITETWDSIARDFNARHGTSLTPWPEGVYGPSDQLAFLPWGHTSMFLMGVVAVDGWRDMQIDYAIMEMARVLHSPLDDFYYINEKWPGEMEETMRVFSMFLEEMLLAEY